MFLVSLLLNKDIDADHSNDFGTFKDVTIPYYPGAIPIVPYASPNLELKDGDIALEGDKDLSKNLVHSETLSPHEATVGKRNKKAPKRDRVGKLVGVKLGALQKTSNGIKGFKESLLSPLTVKGASSKEDSWIGHGMTLLPLKGKATTRGGGRQEPTLVDK
nr:hypothetical protein Iba_chr03bCG0810 [Ipomoea batatas]